MPPAIIAAGIGAVGAIGGAVLSSSGQKSAANQAAQAQQQATDSQLQLGRENIGFQQGIYDQNKALLNPFVQRGNTAGNALNSLLGLGGQQAPQAPANTNTGGFQTNPVAAQEPLNAMAGGFVGGQRQGGLDFGNDLGRGRNYDSPINSSGFYDPYMQFQGQNQNAFAAPQVAPAQAPTVNPQTGAQSATDAFNNFANSAGMQFQLQQGENAISSNRAAHGGFESGAALKALQNYGQNTALNNYFMPYLGLLQGQQATGAQSGSAIAGVGSNFGNTVSNIYGGQQNAIGNAADATSNAALLRGQANAGFGNSLGSALGGFGSAFVNNNPFGGGSGYNSFNSGYSMPVSLPTAQPMSSLPGGFY